MIIHQTTGYRLYDILINLKQFYASILPENINKLFRINF